MSFLTFITGSTKSWQPAMTVNTTTAAYWLNWRVMLCSIWVLMSMVFASVYISKHECRRNSQENAENQQREPPGILYEDEVWRPCLRSIHPGWLLAFRVFAFLLLLLMLILNVAVDGGTIFYFYTQWTFTLITIYFGLGSLLSIRGCYEYKNRGYAGDDIDAERGKGKGRNQEHLVRQEAGCLAYFFQIIFQMNAGAVMLTDSVFWFILVPFLVIKDYQFNFLIINMHSINAVFLLGDTALNSLRFPWFRIGYFFLWTSVYVLFQWILHACVWIWWPYPFLDLSSSYAPLWYSTVALMHIPCYGIFVLIMKGKDFVLSKWFPDSNWKAQENQS
ncbi:UDP-N-acetylglucosamine-N-acetylmuramyl-pyrophosphoryl-undecaprenol N-acetylglucosamine protein [Perilla frutescens var. hirtella]|nr:UDP-N-acetylglucosamine-N-acetylmuramyl-pyrophosphoryl-undecaprenol N-acetylglucosamine protein [Perilla frutescens var. hirtella]KAH6815738.1 UDP-N-acetylglucosamine-N-acetylmuramyl-pyrophosphoryl-undecaprenol N-acetylglucosamine protein [Perilla frutescens var. frutescens]